MIIDITRQHNQRNLFFDINLSVGKFQEKFIEKGHVKGIIGGQFEKNK